MEMCCAISLLRLQTASKEPKDPAAPCPKRWPQARLGPVIMQTNRGVTSLKSKQRTGNPMREFDRLPKELRLWLATAILPWRPASVRRAFARAMAQSNDPDLALDALNRLQAKLIEKDAKRVWGPDHPLASNDASRR